MQKKRIMFLMHSMWEWRWTEKLFWQLSKVLYKNYDIFFVAFHDIRSYTDFEWKYIYLNDSEKCNFFTFLISIFQLRKIIKNNKIDIIIWTNDLLNVIIMISCLFIKIKKIATIHSNPLLNLNNNIKKIVIKILYKYFYKIVCVSKTQEKIMNDKFHLYNTTTIYNFFDTKKEWKKINESLTKNDKEVFKNKFNFLMISRLDKLKWFIPMLRIFKKLNQKYKDTNLIILWEWSYRNNIESFIQKNNLSKNVFLLWAKKNIYPYLWESDCFVFPSLTEAFWLVLIEALLTNKIIVSSDCNIWPKEILHMDSNEKIQYPFYWDYGILCETFNQWDLKKYDTNLWMSLDKKEKELYWVLESIYLNYDKYSLEYSNWKKRAWDFDIHNIVNEWKQLLW